MATDFFFRTALGNLFLCTGQSRVTGNELVSDCGGLAKSVVIGEKPPDLPLFLRARAEKDRMRSGDGRVVGSIIGVLRLAFAISHTLHFV